MNKRKKAEKRILKLLMLCGIMYCSLFTTAQNLVVKPVDIKQKNIVGIAGDQEGLYQAYTVKRNADKRLVLHLSYFNQKFWVIKKSILLDTAAVIRGISVSPKDEVVIYGRFTYQIAPSTTEYRNLLFFSKDNWVPHTRFSQFKEGSLVNSVSWEKDTMLLGGFFDSIGKDRYMNIGKFYNQLFSPITNLSDVAGVNGAVSQISYKNKSIFVSGNFTMAGGVTVKGFTYLENGKWQVITKPFTNADHFAFLGNDVIIHSTSDNDKFFRINLASDKTTDYSLGVSKINRLTRLVSYNNTIHAVGDFNLTLNNIQTGWLSFNTFWNTVNLAQDCRFLDSTKHGLYTVGKDLLGPFPISEVATQYVGRHNPEEKLIYGYLYLDLNTNCVYDSMGDIPVVNRSIRFGTDRNAVFTDKLSRFYYYYFKSNNKTPTVLMDNKSFNYNLCVKDSNDLKNPTKPIIATAIAISPLGIKKAKLDTRVVVHSGQRIRKAGKNAATFLITNVGLAAATNVKVTLKGTKQLKDLLTLTSVKHSVKDSTIEWNLPRIKPLGFAFITVIYGIQDNSDILDNKLDFEVEHTYFDNVGMETGLDFFSQIVTDDDFMSLKEQSLPNQPQGELASIAATDTVIEYQISFQNRTTEVVNEVVVIDTLDLRYHFLYTQTIASSHPFTHTIAQDPQDPNIGYLIYTFSDLNLAPNAAGDPEITNDDGYIKFKSVFDRKHDLNDQIKNTALVIMNDEYYYPTNAVVCSVDRLVSTPTIIKKESLSIYPNPTSETLNIEMENAEAFNYQIIDLKGVIVNSVENFQESQIEVTSLIQGVYILQIMQNGQVWTQKFTKN